ncbi:ADP-ribosylglycohydrolase family protein [Paenibacillus polymyxa]|uniref:ADP-ribosylglycohydrolase family protein n=1 Tax=Paenibacillus polymyxa TaxID=1406 RepID=UPI002AB42F7C|nr:ADP-ribosylglycohydrolase family protein [Paenibacillus polymyxa]MDY7992316.1 ADP-ribosylglycohydrolase family protein [Paenibacillus polymyxa]MDY8118758.1 ADP-ribosylglycohydrolase family protein [Paenibacillus polymyxa]
MVPESKDNKKSTMTQRWELDEDIQVSSVSQCFYCTSFKGNDSCLAFPQGIPREIINNLVLHRSKYLNDNGISFSPIEERYRTTKFKPLSSKGNTVIPNTVLDGLMGVCVGDALGLPAEFSSRASLKKSPIFDMIGYGTHEQPAGTWSDDSSLTFCLGDSLCNGYYITDIADKMKKWYEQSYWTPHGEVFDIGRTTSESVKKLIEGRHPSETGGKQVNDNGNGSLMRILPLSFYLQHVGDEEYKYQVIHDVSKITHAHPRSILACSIYVEYALLLLKGLSLQEAFNIMRNNILNFFYKKEPFSLELEFFKRILIENLMELDEEEINSSGYVIDTLEASFWCLLTTNDYKSAVLKAVNLGNDTDTTAAVTGGLAGIYYGIQQIPIQWINKIAKREMIIELANKMNNIFKCI